MKKKNDELMGIYFVMDNVNKLFNEVVGHLSTLTTCINEMGSRIQCLEKDVRKLCENIQKFN